MAGTPLSISKAMSEKGGRMSQPACPTGVGTVGRTVSLLPRTLFVATCVVVLAQQPPASDAVQQAQTPSPAPSTRPEQTKSPHDQSDVFTPQRAEPSSPVLKQQPKEGKNSGFDFFRDPLGSDA